SESKHYFFIDFIQSSSHVHSSGERFKVLWFSSFLLLIISLRAYLSSCSKTSKSSSEIKWLSTLSGSSNFNAPSISLFSYYLPFYTYQRSHSTHSCHTLA